MTEVHEDVAMLVVAFKHLLRKTVEHRRNGRTEIHSKIVGEMLDLTLWVLEAN